MKRSSFLLAASFFSFAPGNSHAIGADPVSGYSAWLVPWDAADAAAGACFEELNPFVYALSPAGALTLVSPDLLKASARRRGEGALIVPVVVNDVIADGKTVELKSDRALRLILTEYTTAARQIEELSAAAQDYDGIEIDYERIPPDLLGAYAEYTGNLGAALHKRGKRLYIDVEPKLLRNKEMAKLVGAADRIKVMAYYERGVVAAQPGAANSKAWVVDTARLAARVVPLQKLVVAVSLAGTDWAPPTAEAPAFWTAKRLSYGQALELRSKAAGDIRRDESSVPSFSVLRDGREHQIWYEDEKSLGEKIQALHWLGIKRIAFWYWGRQHPDADVLGVCRP
jgi:spore germination protein